MKRVKTGENGVEVLGLNTVKKRLVVMLTIIMVTMIILIGRLTQIQLISTESFSKENVNLIKNSVEQRSQMIVLDQGRGRFIDRNGEALTHDYHPSLILFPFLNHIDWQVEKIADIIKQPKEYLIAAIENAKEPIDYTKDAGIALTESQMNEINQLGIPGVIAVNRQYEFDSTHAEHLIGLIRENQSELQKRYPEKLKEGRIPLNTKLGITGLQQTFDEFLISEGNAKLLYHVDGDGGPLFGLHVKYSDPVNPFYPVSIKTTMDKPIQNLLKQAFDQYSIERGGMVLLDVETSDIVALVSRPKMNPSNPFENGGATNQMVLPQFPGSVFKTVISAAAITKGLDDPNRMFDCNVNLYGDGNSERQLGNLTFKESFFQSCNNTFATLGNEMVEIDKQIIEEYANKLGLVGPVGWRGQVFHFNPFVQLEAERQGKIWVDESDKGASRAIAQTSIGQKEVRVSPLGVASMMATIARNGEKKQVRAVTDILYKNGTTLYSFPEKDLGGEMISPYTAMKLKQLLRGVVTDGTAYRYHSLPYKLAAKTGTAETGKPGYDNHWLAGYFPADNPKYAFAIVDLKQQQSKTNLANVFSTFIKSLYEYEQQENAY